VRFVNEAVEGGEKKKLGKIPGRRVVSSMPMKNAVKGGETRPHGKHCGTYKKRGDCPTREKRECKGKRKSKKNLTEEEHLEHRVSSRIEKSHKGKGRGNKGKTKKTKLRRVRHFNILPK